MNQKKLLKLGMLLIMGVFIMGVAIPAMAGVSKAGNGATKNPNLTRVNTCNNCAGGAAGQAGNKAQNMVKAVADLTNQDINTIRQERQVGKSLLEIAKEKGVEESTVINKVVEQNQLRLKERLDNGTINQAQYDNCISQMENRIKERLERTTTGPANGCGQGRGMGRGAGQGQCPYYQNQK